MTYLITSISKEAEEKKAIDKKLLLFEARVNDSIGNPNISICKQLIDICPECLDAYCLLRKDVVNKYSKTLEVSEDEEDTGLVVSFNDPSVTETKFRKMLTKVNPSNKGYIKLRRRISRIAV